MVEENSALTKQIQDLKEERAVILKRGQSYLNETLEYKRNMQLNGHSQPVAQTQKVPEYLRELEDQKKFEG